MTSVLFFSMVSAFVAGLCCFALGSLVRLRESWRRVLFFLGCMIGFWVSSVVLLADDVADAFSEVQIGMEEAVANAFHQYGLRTGLVAEAGEMPPLPHGRGAPRLCVPADLARPSLTAGSSLPADCALAFGVNSTAVCHQWVLYVPFLLPYLQPCPALRTSADLLDDIGARQVLADAINRPCAYLSRADDLTSRRLRKALQCETVPGQQRVMLIVDQQGGSRILELHPGEALAR